MDWCEVITTMQVMVVMMMMMMMTGMMYRSGCIRSQSLPSRK